MKIWGYLFAFITIIGFSFANKIDNHIDISIGSEHVDWETQLIEITEEQIHQGNLLLVNHDFSVQPSSIQSDVFNLFEEAVYENYGLLDSNIRLSKNIEEKFSEMVQAANKDGVKDFLINSGYRTLEEQTFLYQEMGSSYALPAGHSEHNLGLSLDVGSKQMKMSEAPEGKWIEENAWKYGFVLRYPEDKTEITGIQYEPWHIRYVGLPHSAIMKEKNFVLEEYLDYIKEQRNFSARIEGKEYVISFHQVSDNSPIEVPSHHQYELSGNNKDGVILTVIKE